MYVIKFSLFVLGLLLATGPALTCEATIQTSGGNRDLDDIVTRRQLGDLAIGIFPDDDGSPTRFLRVPTSGCIHLERRHFNRFPTANIYVNNNGDWGENPPTGTFILATSSSTVAVEQADPISFARNSTEGKKTVWSRAGYPDEAAPMKAYKSTRMPPDTADNYFKAADKTQFEERFPKYLAYIASAGEKPDASYSNDMWTYLTSGRPKEYEKRAVPGRFPKLSLMSVAFDARDDNGGKTSQTPRLNLNISGPCTYIFIDSPMEQFRKSLVIQVEGEGVDCLEMKIQ